MATLLFSIDGLRPEAIYLGDMHFTQSLLQTSAYTLNAQTVMPSVTLPCHTSMMRGVDVDRHGITTNTFMPLARPVPSVFDVASAAGLRCGAFFNWGPLRDLFEPESVVVSLFDRSAGPTDSDPLVAEMALPHLAGLDFAFVYFGDTDEVGHRDGWLSEGYLETANRADHAVRQVADAFLSHHPDGNIVLLSDHGGHGKTHGTDLPEDMTIPFIAFGPGTVPGELTNPVRIFDTAPTVARLLGIAPSAIWTGRSAV